MPINRDELKDSVEGKVRRRKNSDRHQSTAATAATTADETSSALAGASQSHQSRINATLQKIAANRNAAIEQVSDVMAYLHSPATFEAEVLARTAEKLGLTNSDQAEITTLDTLATVFEELAEVEYPSFAPYTAAGALPAY